MTSAIRFSRSPSHRSQSTQSAAAVAAAAGFDDGFQHLPSSIPSAPSNPPSQRTRTTTTSTSRGSRGRSTSRSESRPSVHEAPVHAFSLPWTHPPPPSFPAAMFPPQDTREQPHRREGAAGAPPAPPYPYPPPHFLPGYFPFAVPDLPWIPPPPLQNTAEGGYSLPLPYPGSGSAVHYPPPSSRAPAHRVDEMEWPTPDQLPLPSSFPLPPRTLPRPPPASPSHHQSSGYELFPPPPLPPWWFMAALQQGHGWGAVARPRSMSRSSSSSSSSTKSGSSDRAPESRSLSPLPSHRQRQATASLTPLTQRGQPPPPSHHQQQQQRPRPTTPAGTVETPTPLPCASHTSTSTTMTTSTTNNNRTAVGTRDGRGVKEAPPVRRRAMPSGDSTDTAFDVRRSSPGVPPKKEHARPPPPPQEVMDDEEHEEEAEVRRRMQHAVSAAESCLSHIEELYHRLRHRYEEVLLSPIKTTNVRPADAAERSQTQQAAYQTHGGRGEYVSDHTSPTSSPALFRAAPTRAPSLTHSPAPYRLSTSAAAAAPASASQSLRHELAMLESQWLRLEEMKQHGVGLGAVHASSAQSPSIMSTRGGGAVTSSSVASGKESGDGGDFFSNQSVMELINDRKHLLASAA